MKEKFKSYKFWISVLAGVIVLINTLGAVFKFSVNEVAITSIATAVLGLLVILGIVKKEEKSTKDEQIEQQSPVDETSNEIEEQIEQKIDELSKE